MRLSTRYLAAAAIMALAWPAGGARADGLVTLAGAAPTFRADIEVLGAAAPASPVQIQIALRLRRQPELEARTAGGAHLPAAELSDRYLPTQAAHDAVVAWLEGQGLTIERTHPSRMVIGAAGSAAAVGRALGVSFARIRAGGAEWVASDGAPRVPAELAGTILAVTGLQPQLHAVPQHIFAAALPGRPPFYPANFTTAYGVGNQGLAGAGTTTAIVIDTFPLKSDLTAFWKTTGVRQSLANITLIQVNRGKLGPPEGEESLDTETASSIGAASKVRVYAAQNLGYPALDNDFQAVIADLQAGVKITQVSISLGACESAVGSAQVKSDDQMFAVMQSMGASVFVSTGDSGSHACSASSNDVSFYASSPNVTAVGGTSLYVSTAGARKSESGWAGSGGGVSGVFGQPAYQLKLTAYNRRALPDVSADANPNTGAYVVISGHGYQIGGTSLSAPLCAGLFGLANATRLAAGKSSLGALNPVLYPLLGSGDLFDIKTGSNGGYSAKVGYDLVTGIGTPDLAKLLGVLAGRTR